MLVREAKLKGTQASYQALDEAIRTAQFVRNKCVRYWMDNKGVNKAGLYTHCKNLAQEFDVAKKLNSSARQASAERAWASICQYYSNIQTSSKSSNSSASITANLPWLISPEGHGLWG